MPARRKLQVFVSSTYKDLVSERQAAVAALLKAGHMPAGMELFAAGDLTQWDVIQKWIDASDVYVLLLGGRYGSIEVKTGKSYIELEYDYAISKGKRFFSVVITDDEIERRLKSAGSGVIEQEQPVKLKEFRTRVMSRMCSFFSDIKDVKTCIYESMLELADDPTLVGWVDGRDAEDVRPLREEIERLKKEMQNLRQISLRRR